MAAELVPLGKRRIVIYITCKPFEHENSRARNLLSREMAPPCGPGSIRELASREQVDVSGGLGAEEDLIPDDLELRIERVRYHLTRRFEELPATLT